MYWSTIWEDTFDVPATIEDHIFDASPWSRVFNDKEPNTPINPDEAVEYSAAVQGASHRRRVFTVKTAARDVTPLPMI